MGQEGNWLRDTEFMLRLMAWLCLEITTIETARCVL